MDASAAPKGPDSQRPEAQGEGCGWRVVAASVRGPSHEATCQPCQDAHHWALLPKGVMVAAAGDGAGSAAQGEVGAALATRTAVETLRTRGALPPWSEEAAELWRGLLTDALHAARRAVDAEAAARGVPARDLATTLLLVVATPDLVAVAQVGDGAVVAGDRDGNIIGLTVPQRGEYLNETTFLTSPHALETVQVTVRRTAVAHVAVLSDGLQMLALKMPDGTPHAPFFAPLFRFGTAVGDETEAQAQFLAFLCAPRLRARAEDDLTLLVATWVR